jgi:chorismate dehydratase
MRIGVVRYANTLPLATGLSRHLPGAEIVLETPAAIAEGLAMGTLDVGIVPVAALAEHPEWRVAEGLGIVSDGPVRSVLLLANKPIDETRRLVIDPASRTSNVLARLWLRERLGRDVEIVPGGASVEERLAAGDAAVVIGDDALFWPGRVPERVDLGGAWRSWTGLPFVFAVWAGPGAGAAGLAEALLACYEENATRLDVLARDAAPGDPARQALLESYLRHHVRYRLGAREREGMDTYLARGREAGYFAGASAGSTHAVTG